MPIKHLPFVLLMLLVCLYTPLASAQIYTWVDAKGETHFSDQPPPSAKNKAQPVKRTVSSQKAMAKKRVQQQKPVARKKVSVRKKQVERPKKQVRKQQVARRVASVPKSQQARSKQSGTQVKKQSTVEPKNPRKKKLASERARSNAQQASFLLASLNATVYDIERIAKPKPQRSLKPTPKQERIFAPSQNEPEITPDSANEAFTSDDVFDEFSDRDSSSRGAKATPIGDFKQSLCQSNRRNLAILEEQGFEYYIDDKGDLRVAWGVEGFYRQKAHYLKPSEVETMLAKIRLEVEHYCDKPFDIVLQDKARQDWIRSEYCHVSRVILADLKHPFMRTTEEDIEKQAQEVERFCSTFPDGKFENDEQYFPKSLNVDRLQQTHFLYR